MAKLASIQRAFVPVHARGVDGFKVSGFNDPLKSEAEQRLINDRFQVVLASLTHPLQIIMRVIPFCLERYLASYDPRDQQTHLGTVGRIWLHLLATFCKLSPKNGR